MDPVKALRPAAARPPAVEAPMAQLVEPEAEFATDDSAPPERKSLLQRLGPVGIVLLAIMAGAAAWLASSFIKF